MRSLETRKPVDRDWSDIDCGCGHPECPYCNENEEISENIIKKILGENKK